MILGHIMFSTEPVSGFKWYSDDDWFDMIFKSTPNLTKSTQIGEKSFDLRKIKNKFRGLK